MSALESRKVVRVVGQNVGPFMRSDISCSVKVRFETLMTLTRLLSGLLVVVAPRFLTPCFCFSSFSFS